MSTPGADGPGAGRGRPVIISPPRRSVRRDGVRMTILVVSVLLLAFLAASWSARIAARAHPTLAGTWPKPALVIAHQGGDGLWPSSTRLAFERAAALGVDVIEMDVHLSADGELVVIHDATLERTTDGEGAVAEASADELATLDAGYHWSPGRSGSRFPYRSAGQGVPRLREVLADHPDARLLIEIKPPGTAAAEALCSLLRAEGRAGDAVVASFHRDAMAGFRSACPEVATAATPDEVRLFLVLARARLDGPYRPPFDALQVPVSQGSIQVITPALIRAAHAKGVQVHAWTIDNPAEMKRLLEMGVDGLITDRPDRALRVVGRQVDDSLVPDFVSRK